MKKLSLLFFMIGTIGLEAQQVMDSAFSPAPGRPRYPGGQGSRIVVDEAHHNFHTVNGRYHPFAKLLRADGYRVEAGDGIFTPGYLQGIDVLVIANATDNRPWILPTHSAFTEGEIAAVSDWVRGGGRLFLVADHMPMAGAAAGLAKAFGFTFHNGFAVRRDGKDEVFTRADSNLVPNEITDGRVVDERVDSVMCFTGQGFSLPPGAEVVMRLGPGYKVLLPDTAWKFTKYTRSIDGDGLVIGAFLRYGTGRVVVFGEAAMFTAQLAGPRRKKVGMNQTGARGNARLLLNIVHWLDPFPGE